MIDIETYKKIDYFNSRTTFTETDLLKEFSREELLNMYANSGKDANLQEFFSRCNQRNVRIHSPELEKRAQIILESPEITAELINDNFNYDEKMYMLFIDEHIFKKLIERCKGIKYLTDQEAVSCLLNYWGRDVLEIAIKSLDDDKLLLPHLQEMGEMKVAEALNYRNKPFSTEVAKVLIDMYPNNERILSVLSKLINDEQRIELFNKVSSEAIKGLLIRTLQSIDLKLIYLNKLKGQEREETIYSIEEDDVKVKFLTFTTRNKGDLIASIKSDELKEQLLLQYKTFLKGEEIGKIVASFKNKVFIYKYFYLLKGEKAKVSFVENCDYAVEDLMLKAFLGIKKISNLKSCAYRLKYMTRAKEAISYINNQSILIELFSPEDSELELFIFSKLTPSNKAKVVKEYREGNKEIVSFYNEMEMTPFLYESIAHTEEFPEYNEKYNSLITNVANYFHYSTPRLIKLAQIFGLGILAKLDNINIIQLLSTSNDDFQKIVHLFSEEVTEFTVNNLNDALNSMIQRKFRITHPNKILIFTQTLRAVADDNKQEVLKYIEIINEVIALTRFNITKEELVVGLMKKNPDIIELYNKITNEYIKILRTKFDIEEKQLADILYSMNSYEKNSLVKYLMKTFTVDDIISVINTFFNKTNYYEGIFTKEETELIKDLPLLRKVIEFKKNPKDNKEISGEVKDKISVLEEMLMKVYKNKHFVSVKRAKSAGTADKNELLETLCELGTLQFKDTVLKDDEIYQELVELLSKKKIHCWLGRFGELPGESDVDLYPSVIASLITNYKEIRKLVFKEEANKVKEILKNFINSANEVNVENILLNNINNPNGQRNDLIVMLEEMSTRCKIPASKLVKKLIESSKLIKTSGIESAVNVLNPEIKSLYNKEQIYHILLKINSFSWRIAYENIIKKSPISPKENEVINLFNTIDKINSYVPELKNSFILENLFDSAIIYRTTGIDEALECIDKNIKDTLPKDVIEKILVEICEFVKNIKKQSLVSSTALIDMANCFDSSSKRVRLLFGKENFDLLKRNPMPYRGEYTSKQRISTAIELLKELHERKFITVPPSRDTYTLHNKKQINISVGDLHNLDNLTLGERTGACMRIGGPGYSLFNFCLKNINGFHVLFTDPENGKIVSRVSGFRNGNTVFLNELRFSLREKYTNENIVEACRMFSKRLIEDSKNSKYPIDNVVISPYFAMKSHSNESQDIGVQNIQKGYKSFYIDVSQESIVLATSNEDNSLVPIKLGPSNAERYELLRRDRKIGLGLEAIDLVLQTLLLDKHYGSGNYEDFDIDVDKDIIYAIQGEDWYISVDSTGKIDNYIMENSNDPKKAKEEMTESIEQTKEYITQYGLDDIKSQSALGGVLKTYGIVKDYDGYNGTIKGIDGINYILNYQELANTNRNDIKVGDYVEFEPEQYNTIETNYYIARFIKKLTKEDIKNNDDRTKGMK